VTTSLQSDLAHKQPEHDAIAADINAWLDKGHVIEKLGNTPVQSGKYAYNNQEKRGE
jgi:hypothetical protein